MSKSSTTILKAPFPAFGGKSQVADDVWVRLGDVRNYIEPFAFSASVLLRRPGGAGPIETINDRNGYVANFWRAVRADPEAVAAHADWPIVEDDLHARHRWLVTSDDAKNKLEMVRGDPDYFDAKIAGWWCWGACCWIGSGWCDETHRNGRSEQKPDTGDARGINVAVPPNGKRVRLTGFAPTGVNLNAERHVDEKRPRAASSVNGWMPGVLTPPELSGNSSELKRPRLHGGAGGDPPGVHSGMVGAIADTHRIQLADAYSRGRGVNGNDAASVCDVRREWLIDWMMRLADRLRPVRVCCGHWARVCDSDSTLTRLGTTGVFLDPPYRKELACGKKNRNSHIYANDKSQNVNALCDEVSAWCLKWGSDPEIRIALCGLEGEYPAIDDAGWTKVPWKSNGYGNRSEAGKENAARERIWYSPACLSPVKEPSLFTASEVAA